jgi:hypothetical protein
MDIQQIVAELKKPFPAEEHKERSLPGGGRWFYIPWQLIRKRLDEVCPDWQVVYADPIIAGELVVIRCRLTICGISREGVGNSEAFIEKTEAGMYKFGTPIEKAIADAFKNAAEAFGVARYLDDQQYVIRHMQSQGDGRGYAFSKQRQTTRTQVQNRFLRSS